MTERHHLKLKFLKNTNLKDFELHPIPADASFRTYDRVRTSDGDFMLMNSPKEHYSLTPFIEITKLLRSHNLPAPEIYHIDDENGFLLIEDFGSVSIKDLLIESSHMETEIYSKIIDLLTDIQKIPADHLEHHSLDVMLEGLEVFADWYIPFKTGNPMSIEAKREYLEQWRRILCSLPESRTLVLRDFHVENLMHAPGKDGHKIGILDFQDASMGNPAYDLVSLLQDARYDVSLESAKKMIDYYLTLHPEVDRDKFLGWYNILGAQRNSRILGYFARKAKRDGAMKYLEFMPRVLRYLEQNLRHASFKRTKFADIL